MTFEQIVRRIATALSFDLTREELHDAFVDGEGMTEEDFFLCFHAAKVFAGGPK